MALFRSRGWTSIVTDILVDSVLQMVSLGVGVLTGLVVGLTAVMGNWSHGVLAGAPVYVNRFWTELRLGVTFSP